jgi:hypothetical protein
MIVADIIYDGKGHAAFGFLQYLPGLTPSIHLKMHSIGSKQLDGAI